MGVRGWRRGLSIAIAAVAATGMLATSVVAAPGAPPARDRTEDPPPAATAEDLVVVEFADPPAAAYEGGIRGLARTKPRDGDRLDPRAAEVRAYRAHLQGVHGNFERWLDRTAAGAMVVAELTLVANAVAVEGATAAQLRRGPGVVSAAPAAVYRPAMNASVGVIGADEVWPLLDGRDVAGSGVKVGVIDSGIDPVHPFFDCEVEGGAKLLGATTYASGVMGVGLDIVFDHGTHVAGTIGGCVIPAGDDAAPTWLGEGDAISGVAPGAQLYDFNVFPGFGGGFVAFGGSAFSHDIARALEDAVVRGMDVVNLSLGGGVQGPNDFLQRALDRTVDAGVVAVVSAGNEGPGDATIGSPGTAPNAITVGATTNSHVVGVSIEVDGLEAPIPGASGDFDPFSENEVTDHPVSDWGGLACTPGDGDPDADVEGTVVLVDRGTCTFTTKVRNAEAAGADGVLIVNNQAGPATAPAHDGSSPIPTIPVLGISQDDGDDIRDLLGDDEVRVTIAGELQEFDADADLLAAFSSRGPTPFTRSLKPEIVAPGVNIVSSVFQGEWAAFQGTSMAAPHVAGAAALLLDADATLEPYEVKSALVNRARDLEYGVLEQGAGRLDVPAAYDATVFADPAAISFEPRRGNTNRAAPAVTVELSGSGLATCTASVETGSPATVSDVDEGTFTVALPSPRELTPGGHEGVVTVECGEQELRIPWYAQVDRNR